MLGLSFAAVPLYDLFCRVTGFGGTTQNASNKEIPKIVGQIVEILTDATSTKVDPMPDEDEVMEGKKKENAEES